jgi:lysozyme family protein
MSDSIDAIISGITAAESGTFTNNPDDAGGATRWGIDLGTLRTIRGPSVTAYDVAALSQDDANAIYRQRYIVAPHFDTIIALDEALASEVINCGVMSGPSTAAKMLQRVCNVMNQRGKAYSDITVDGQFGAGSQLALQQLFKLRGGTDAGIAAIRTAFVCLWGAFLIGLAETTPTDENFIYGWISQRVDA